jgi:D-3-phosphoglycerate dehydrogenase
MALLEAAPGVTFDYVTDPDPRAYLAALPRAEGLVLRTQPLTAADVADAPKLSVVARHGVGYDAVDVAALDARGIPLAIVGDVNSRTVAEHAMALLLAASRRIGRGTAAMRAGDWGYRNAFTPREIDGKTLLIIGYGRIGRRLAQLATAFGMRVLAHDPFVPAGGFDGAEHAPELGAALAEADAVSVHVPATDGPVLGTAELAQLKPGAVVVNTARGGVVDEAALLAALESGQVGAAGLDVFGEEPPAPDAPLIHHPEVVVTPHAAGITLECAERMARAAVQNVLDHFAGRLDPALVVNLKG